MELLNTQVSLYQVVAVVLIYYVFSAAVGAMEMPDQFSSKGYRFVFRFLNILSANLHRAAEALNVPQSPK